MNLVRVNPEWPTVLFWFVVGLAGFVALLLFWWWAIDPLGKRDPNSQP
jgi:hypothetical protein